MTFSIDDVMEVLKIVRECKDTELHIDTGEMKLSLVKGKVSSSGAGFITPGPPAQNPGAAEPVKVAEPAAAPAAAPAAPPQAEAVPEPAPAAASEPESEEGLVPVTANVTSVFYRKPSPEEPAFIEVGDAVEEDTVVCLLEVMKCFRQVLAGASGVIEKICVESNSLVEEGTVLFLIRPE